MKILLAAALSGALSIGSSFAQEPHTPEPYVKVAHPEWAQDAVLYQINTRQFTQEGTFAAAATHLPRLAEMGVDILWLMPVHPIGEEKRKGSLGSPYSVKDYRAVNPEFGTVEDLKAFVGAAHELGMHVILDWVANHSAWDNPLTESHPDWYAKGPDGGLTPTPWTDWSDIVDFDYNQPELRAYMSDAMAYWVEEVGLDGFRADVAGFVPLDFWDTLRVRLERTKPVFMLAEWETRDMHQRAFDATYSWQWKESVQEAAAGGGAAPIRFYWYEDQNSWPDDAYRMVYTSNHDQNAWDGAAPEIYGDAYELAIAYSFVSEGMPLIYNGQEVGLGRKLAFFEKDEIEWVDDHPLTDLFTRLIALKHDTRALWNGSAGVPLVPVETGRPETVFAFTRFGEEDGVLAMFNMSDAEETVRFNTDRVIGRYTDFGTGRRILVAADSEWTLPPWGYRILRRD